MSIILNGFNRTILTSRTLISNLCLKKPYALLDIESTFLYVGKNVTTDRSSYRKDYREKYGDFMREQIKEWFNNHSYYLKKWRADHKAYFKDWLRKNPEYRKGWLKRHPDYFKRWHEEHKEYWKVYIRNYMRRYRKGLRPCK